MNHHRTVKLGFNIDHVATVRQARRGAEPNVLRAALEGLRGGACGITAHLREDRRHIQDADLPELKRCLRAPLNLEMSVHEEIVRIACRLRPEKACLVPERRQELTTEGGLDVVRYQTRISQVVQRLRTKNVVVSLFVDPVRRQIEAARQTGSQFIELHTGRYARLRGRLRGRELARLRESALLAHSLGLGVNAGHGLDYENVQPVARLPHMEELNIGHSIIGRSLFIGVRDAVREMVLLIRRAQNP